MSHHYRLSQLKIDSAIELPELSSWDGAPDTRSDIVFRIGKVPQGLEKPDHVGPDFQTRGALRVSGRSSGQRPHPRSRRQQDYG